ncbi:MAG: hypothetical protein GXP49_08055 [Deltaproteobacteria bacterium]|nr:hypothetical protein [Deltaproteobacteria bacterium]
MAEKSREKSLRLVFSLCLLLASWSCFEQAPGVPLVERPKPKLWQNVFKAPDVPDAFSPAMADGFSSWGVYKDKQALAAKQGISLRRLRPDYMSLSFFGIGNGRVFAFEGGTYPLNTLHDMIGPDMQKGTEGFFGDVSLQVGSDPSAARLFEKEWIFRARNAPVTITKAIVEGGDIALYTLDFAPRGLPRDHILVENTIIRVAIVENLSGQPVKGLEAFTTAATKCSVSGNTAGEQRNEKVIRYTCLDGTCETYEPSSSTINGGLIFSLDDLRPGATRELSMVFAFTTQDRSKDGDATISDAKEIGWRKLLEYTTTWWKTWLDATTTIHTQDPKVDDLLQGLKMTLKLQQTATGSATPISHYASTWTRDQMGWARYFLAIGDYEDVASILDYAYAAACYNGGLYNAVDSNLDPDKAPDPPDWLSLPAGSGRTAAEGPSYIPIMYDLLYRSTGWLDRIEQRLDYLQYCITCQQVNEQGLLGFSGDETFRTAMAINLGMDATFSFEDLAYSANSSFLFLAAKEGFARMTKALGRLERNKDIGARAALVLNGLEKHFLVTGKGYYAPFLLKDGLVPGPAPFEDVNTKPLWLGVESIPGQREQDNIEALIDSAYRGDGLVVSHSGQDVEIFGINLGNGIYTGMSPGYVLYDLTAMNSPLAKEAFNALNVVADLSGNFSEDIQFDGNRPIQPFYFPSGGQGELWTRFRPWEGGICGEAALYYLTGRKLDCPESTLSLFPRLPNNWSKLEVENMRLCPSDDLNFTLEDTGTSLLFTIEASSLSKPYDLTLNLAVPGPMTHPRVMIGDNVLGQSDYLVTRKGDQEILTIDMKLDTGKVISVTY